MHLIGGAHFGTQFYNSVANPDQHFSRYHVPESHQKIVCNPGALSVWAVYGWLKIEYRLISKEKLCTTLVIYE